MGHGEVGTAVAVEVANRQGFGLTHHLERHGRREGPVAQAVEDGNIAALGVRNGEVEDAVAVEIGRHDGAGIRPDGNRLTGKAGRIELARERVHLLAGTQSFDLEVVGPRRQRLDNPIIRVGQ